MKTIYKILRVTAWILVVITIFTLFSGFLTTKYFLTPWLGYNSAYFIHTIIIPLLFIPFFYLHSLTGLLTLIARHQTLNKKYVKIIIGVVWTGIFVLFVIFYTSQNPVAKNIKNNPSVNSSANSPGSPANISLTLSEINRHNLAADCWMIISNKVYDLTNYLKAHPGGPSAISPYCGKDGTSAFATKDIGRPHSPSANSLLVSFYLGDIGQTIGNQQTQNIRSQSQNLPQNNYEDD